MKLNFHLVYQIHVKMALPARNLLITSLTFASALKDSEVGCNKFHIFLSTANTMYIYILTSEFCPLLCYTSCAVCKTFF